METKAIIFSAPSGAGKTTIVRALLEQNLTMEFSISATSREPRGAEAHGKDYYFLGINGFKLAIDNDELLEWEEVYPNQFYGTLNRETNRIWKSGKAVIFDVDVYGGIEIKKKLGNNALAIFVMPPTMAVLAKRLNDRGTDSSTQIAIRMQKAAKEIAMKDAFDFVLINDDIETAIYQAAEGIKAFLTK